MQKTSINYLDEVESFEVNSKYSGVIPGNVYCGFDTITNVQGLTFQLIHDLTGQVFPDIDLEIGPKLGVWVTMQGVTVKEDGPVSLAISTNVGNSKPRTDLLIGRHNHDTLTEGGTPATYEIIRGALETSLGIDPPISSPETATLLGRFIVPANTASLTSLKWQRNRSPVLGGELPAILSGVNRYKEQQQFNQGLTTQVVRLSYELADRGTITGLVGGNTFRVGKSHAILDLIEDKPDGTEINLYFDDDVAIRGFEAQLHTSIYGTGVRAGYTNGLRPILIKDEINSSLLIKKNQMVTLIKMSSGRIWVGGNPEVIAYGDYWKLVSVSDTPERVQALESELTQTRESIGNLNTTLNNLQTIIDNINPPRSLVHIDYQGTYELDFDSTGKGKPGRPYYGYAECNGQNGTRNYGGKRLVGRDQNPIDANVYKEVGNAGGNKTATIEKANLPNVRIGIRYLWRNWRGNSDSNNFGTMSAIYPDNVGGNGWDKTGTTEPLGEGKEFNIESPYQVTLILMWIGAPPIAGDGGGGIIIS